MLFGKLFTNPKMWMNGDANEIKMGGVYTCKDVQNVPTGDGALFVFKSEDTIKQVFVPVGEEGVVYTRVIGEDWSSVTGTSEETEALIQSAIDKANQAQAKADTVDTRLNNIIVESGTSDAEVVAARTDSNGQTFTTLGARLDTQFGEIKEDLRENNSYNIFDAYGKYLGGTAQGATLTWDDNHVGTITRAEAASANTVFGTILGNTNEIPAPLVKGETYILQSDITDDNVLLQKIEYRGSNSRDITISGVLKYTVPNDIDGIMFRILVRKGFSGTATIRVKMLNAPTNKMLDAEIEDELNRKATVSSDINVTSANQSDYPNVDNFPNRTIINIISTANVINKPFTSCTIITTGFSTTNLAPYGGSKQIAINSFNGAIACRTNNGVKWSDWTYTNSIFIANNTNYIDVIENALSVTNATVILESGTYTLFDATHNEAYWKNKRPATRYCGINLKNGIKIIGNGIVNFDANYAGNDDDIKENFSVFNIAGSCEIRNINIDASNICYLVHDDPRIVNSQNNSCIVHGCKLIHNGTDHTFTTGAPMCIGAGESDNSYREYTDNVLDSSYDRSANVHTATNGKGRYIITGNYFIKGTLGFTAFGDGTGRIEGIISNNSLPSDIVNRSNGASTPYTFNNAIRN